MNKFETIARDEPVIAQLHDKISALETECRQLKRQLAGETAEGRSGLSGLDDHAEIVQGLGQYEWDETADRCTVCSEGLAHLTGTAAGDLAAQCSSTAALIDRIHPADREAYRRALESLRATHQPINIEYRLRTADGYVPVIEVRQPVLDVAGRLVKSSGLLRDITELSAAREAKSLCEQRLDDLTADSRHFVWEMDADLRFSFVSDGIREVTGEDPAEFIGKTRRDIAGQLPIDPEALQSNLDQMERREVFENFLIKRPRTTGGVVHLNINGRPVFSANGAFVGYRGTARDVSDLKAAISDLHLSEERYRDLVDGSIQGVIVSLESKPVFANQACADIFGFSSVESFLALDSIETLLPEGDLQRASAADKQPVRHTIEALRQDGSKIWLDSINRAIDWRGRPALQTTVVDITESKRAELALRESEARLRAIMDHAPVEIILKDARGRYLEVNRHFERLWNVSNDAVRGKLPSQIAEQAQLAERTEAHDRAVLREQRMIQRETILCGEAGVRCLHATKFPIRDSFGAVVGIGAIAIDATDRWVAEENLRQARNQLETNVKERTAELERLNADMLDSQTRLQDAIESISDGFVLFDSTERLVMCNSQCRVMFPVLADRLTVGTPLEELLLAAAERGLVPDANCSKETWISNRLCEFRSKSEETYEHQTADGRWMQARLRNTAEGGSVAILTDITDRKRDAMALAESEDRLRQAAQLAGIGYCIWDSIADRCIYCSEEYAAIHGTTVDGYLAKAAPAGADCPFTHPDDREAYKRATETLRRDGIGFGLEYRMVLPNGDLRHVRTIVKPVFDEDGRVVQEYLTIQDITAQKENEIALRNNKDLLMAIIDHAPAEVDVKDEDGRFVIVNRQMENALGVVRQDLIGRTSAEVFPPEGAKVCCQDDDQVMETGEEAFSETIRETDTGSRHFLSVKFKIPQLAGSGAAIGRISTDITELKQGERKLREQQEILETIMAAAPVSITVKHPDSRYIYVNRNELSAFGIETEDYLGKTPHDLLEPEMAAQIVAADRMVVETGQAMKQYEEQLVDSHNRVRHWLSAKIPVIVEEKVRYIVTTSLDVTETKARENELRQAQKMEAVGRLTGGIAHDFNNLLAVINGNLLFIRRKADLNAETSQYLDAIETAAKMGTSLTGELLAFSRPRELSPTRIDLPVLVQDMIRSLFRALPASIDIRTDFGSHIWPVHTDPQQLQNALFNIALNARDAMPDGGTMEIRLRNTETVPGETRFGGPWVEITISDTGIGIAKDQLDRVFEPFFTTKPAGAGTGLGMSMVHRFVKAAGGHIRLDSDVGVGTAITIYLPRSGSTHSPPMGIRQVKRPVAQGTETILVVEDDDGVRRIATQTLMELGYTVLEAANGEDALAILEENPSIALLFSDIELGGGLDGFSLAEAARQIRPDLRILFCSGHAESEDTKVDGTKLIAKPYQPTELGQLVRQALL